jgi:outer membrane protein OmpA-like peptidoglycan-associated protein
MKSYIAIFSACLLAFLPGCGNGNKQKKDHTKKSFFNRSKKSKNDEVLAAFNLGDMEQFSGQTEENEYDEDLLNWQDSSIHRTDGQFKPVYFDFDKYNVRDDQKSIVDEDIQQAKKAMKKNKSKKLVVEGHASPEKGSRAYNMALSQKRAENIKAEHMKQGVPEENIATVGRGQEMPVKVSPSTEENWVNRRVEEFAIDQN